MYIFRFLLFFIGSITRERFIDLANEIHRTFPREAVSTYYTPFRSENGVSINPSGKLWYHYDYLKGKMRDDGILKGGRNADVREVAIPLSGEKTIVIKIMKNVTNEIFSIDFFLIFAAAAREKVLTLKTKLEPWVEVLILWNDTFEYRQSTLLDEKLPVLTYLQNYAGLRVQNAAQLVLSFCFVFLFFLISFYVRRMYRKIFSDFFSSKLISIVYIPKQFHGYSITGLRLRHI